MNEDSKKEDGKTTPYFDWTDINQKQTRPYARELLPNRHYYLDWEEVTEEEFYLKLKKDRA